MIVKTAHIRILVLIAALSIGQLHSQTGNYSTELGITYYSDSMNSSDTYINERCRLDVYYPTSKSKAAVVVWFHGGGLSSGNKFIPKPLKNKGIVVVAVNYRLAPKVENPQYLLDAAASIDWVFKNIQNYNGDINRIYVSGHSAGGYLALMLGFNKQLLGQYNINNTDLAGVIGLSGHTFTHFQIRAEREIPKTQVIIDEYAPVFHVSDEISSVLLITGDREKELLGRYEENAFLMRMLQEVGHTNNELYELEGYDHVSMVEPSYDLMLNFINKKK